MPYLRILEKGEGWNKYAGFARTRVRCETKQRLLVWTLSLRRMRSSLSGYYYRHYPVFLNTPPCENIQERYHSCLPSLLKLYPTF